MGLSSSTVHPDFSVNQGPVEFVKHRSLGSTRVSDSIGLGFCISNNFPGAAAAAVLENHNFRVAQKFRASTYVI